MILSMIGRSSIVGCVPLFAITANITRAGKGKLFQLASLIAMGRDTAITTFPRKEDELAKVITSVAIEGTPVVVFDNMTSRVGGDALDAVLTSRTWKARVLSKSETTGELPMRTVWCATGNNLQFGSDMAGRVIPIRLQSPLENPEERTGFRHSDIETWTNFNRSRLSVAALTILRAYFVAERPFQPGGAFGGFDEWSQVVRGALMWACQVDPMATRSTAKENDENKYLLGLLMTGLGSADESGRGLTTKKIGDLVDEMNSEDGSLRYPELAEAVDIVCPRKFSGRSFGKKLSAFNERIFEGKQIRGSKGMGGIMRWFVVDRTELDDKKSSNPLNPLISDETHSQTHSLKDRNLLSKFTHSGFSGSDSEVHDSKGTVGVYEPAGPCEPALQADPLNPLNPLCPKCGGELAATEPIAGWRNWDCSGCGFVEPRKDDG